VIQQEWRRAHAEGAEGKAGHRWGKMEEDVLPAADRSRQKRGGRGD
jgi:hypothetical protein